MRTGLILLVLAFLGAAPAAHAARTAPCTEAGGAPRCTFWDARISFIADGDTIRVRQGGHIRTLRFIGINAMELSRYSKYPSRRRGACHGLEATALVEKMIRASHGRVRIAAQHAGSRTGKRLRRSIWVRSHGRWRDLSRMEIARGLALWLPNGDENAHNREYLTLAEQAAAAGRGLYDTDACGAGPDQDVPLTVSVNWDADGDDEGNLDGEWVEIHNGGARTVDLGDWWVRDSWLRIGRGHAPGYRFAAGTALPAGATLRLHAGCGADTARDKHWCQSDAVWENAVGGMGDGGYLFDPGGDLRAWSIYPCVVACADPLAGRVSLDAHPSRPESISIANTSGGPVDLGGHVVQLHLHGERDAFVFGYPFEPGTVLAPGEVLRVLPDGSPSQDTRLERHLGRGPYAMPDGQGRVSLRTATDIVTACTVWGGIRCD